MKVVNKCNNIGNIVNIVNIVNIANIVNIVNIVNKWLFFVAKLIEIIFKLHIICNKRKRQKWIFFLLLFIKLNHMFRYTNCKIVINCKMFQKFSDFFFNKSSFFLIIIFRRKKFYFLQSFQKLRILNLKILDVKYQWKKLMKKSELHSAYVKANAEFDSKNITKRCAKLCLRWYKMQIFSGLQRIMIWKIGELLWKSLKFFTSSSLFATRQR